MADLWAYNSTSRAWSLLWSAPFNFGGNFTQDETAAPPALISPTLWTDPSGKLWIFGGGGPSGKWSGG